MVCNTSTHGIVFRVTVTTCTSKEEYTLGTSYLCFHVTGTDRGSTKKHGDTLIVENRDTVNEYDYITVRDPDLSKQNHPYELVPFDYIQPVINANEKLPAQTDYCVPMQGNIHINVHDPGKSHQPNTANNQYDNKPSLKGVVSIQYICAGC